MLDSSLFAILRLLDLGEVAVVRNSALEISDEARGTLDVVLPDLGEVLWILVR